MRLDVAKGPSPPPKRVNDAPKRKRMRRRTRVATHVRVQLPSMGASAPPLPSYTWVHLLLEGCVCSRPRFERERAGGEFLLSSWWWPRLGFRCGPHIRPDGYGCGGGIDARAIRVHRDLFAHVCTRHRRLRIECGGWKGWEGVRGRDRPPRRFVEPKRTARGRGDGATTVAMDHGGWNETRDAVEEGSSQRRWRNRKSGWTW